MTKQSSIRRTNGSRLRKAAMLSALAATLALGACQSNQDEAPAPAERKSPFATGNVSVAPQIEGREAAPTPVPAPRPTQ